MNIWRMAGVAIATTVLLAACGGNDDEGPPANTITYTRLVSFGDSLSDVGTYATPGLLGATGGGRFTVNGPTTRMWVDHVATAASVTPPCAAQTGLNSVGPLAGFAAPVTNNTGCFGYAQGGSRVTDPVGPGNLATFPAQSSGAIGQLTVPVITQITNHLAASGGRFSGTELVTVLAGANDLFMQLGIVQATVAAGGNPSAAGQAAAQAMGLAGGQLAAYIQNLMVANGAKRILVVGIPDVSVTPDALGRDQATRDLIQLLSFTFNAQLQFGLQNVAEVLYVDGYTAIQNWSANPGNFGLSNVSAQACNAAVVASSLLCSPATLIAGDTSKYLFADGVHPTPYGHELFANAAVQALKARGWL